MNANNLEVDVSTSRLAQILEIQKILYRGAIEIGILRDGGQVRYRLLPLERGLDSLIHQLTLTMAMSEEVPQSNRALVAPDWTCMQA